MECLPPRHNTVFCLSWEFMLQTHPESCNPSKSICYCSAPSLPCLTLIRDGSSWNHYHQLTSLPGWLSLDFPVISEDIKHSKQLIHMNLLLFFFPCTHQLFKRRHLYIFRIIYLKNVCTETLRKIKKRKQKQWCVYVRRMILRKGSFKMEFNPRLGIYSNVEPICRHCQNTEKHTERETATKTDVT